MLDVRRRVTYASRSRAIKTPHRRPDFLPSLCGFPISIATNSTDYIVQAAKDLTAHWGVDTTTKL